MELKLSVVTKEFDTLVKDLKVSEDKLLIVIEILQKGFQGKGGLSLNIAGPNRFVSVNLLDNSTVIYENYKKSRHLL